MKGYSVFYIMCGCPPVSRPASLSWLRSATKLTCAPAAIKAPPSVILAHRPQLSASQDSPACVPAPDQPAYQPTVPDHPLHPQRPKPVLLSVSRCLNMLMISGSFQDTGSNVNDISGRFKIDGKSAFPHNNILWRAYHWNATHVIGYTIIPILNQVWFNIFIFEYNRYLYRTGLCLVCIDDGPASLH